MIIDTMDKDIFIMVYHVKLLHQFEEIAGTSFYDDKGRTIDEFINDAYLAHCAEAEAQEYFGEY
jgi:hypothetical protein